MLRSRFGRQGRRLSGGGDIWGEDENWKWQAEDKEDVEARVKQMCSLQGSSMGESVE